jgi:hypothetical protein
MAESVIISEYHERIRGLLNRRLTLFRESVKVVGRVRGNPGEGTVWLADLQPTPHRMWVRSKHYHWSLAMILVLTPFLSVPFMVFPPNFLLLALVGVCYLLAILYFVNSIRRMERVLFLNRSGVLALDLWRAGPDRDRFPEFVAAIEKQISEQRAAADRSAPLSSQ